MRKFKNIGRIEDLKFNHNAYIRKDLVDIRAGISASFTEDGGEIPSVPILFFKGFIDNQASLYTYKFKRNNFNDKMIDVDSLNDEMKYHERYYHNYRKSGVYHYVKENKIMFKALSPLNYFKDGDYCFIQSKDNLVILFIKDGSRILTFEITKEETKNNIVNDEISMYDLVVAYDLDKDIEANFKNFGTAYTIEEKQYNLKEIPLIEMSYRDIDEPTINFIALLELRIAVLISFGIYQAEPKLITHAMYNTSDPKAMAKEVLKQFGKRNRTLVMPLNGKMQLFETGDINVFVQLKAELFSLLEQQCLINGVDYHALIPSSKTGNDVESGESKKMTLEYINNYRRDFYSDFSTFERNMFILISKNFESIKNNDVTIVFEDKDINETKDIRLDYAIKARENNIMTQDEVYAYVKGVSQEDAKKALDMPNNDNEILNKAVVE